MTGSKRLSEQERRSQILRATVEVVARDGFDRASARQIAEHAGIAKGLIWRYFDDKTDLMKQAVTSTFYSLAAEIQAEIGTPGLADDGFRAHIRAVTAAHARHPDEFSAMDQITRALRGPDGEYAFSLVDYEDTYLAYEALFRRAQQQGVLRPFDTRVMAVTYQAAIDIMLSYFNSHPDVDRQAYADALADLLLGLVENR